MTYLCVVENFPTIENHFKVYNCSKIQEFLKMVQKSLDVQSLFYVQANFIFQKLPKILGISGIS